VAAAVTVGFCAVSPFEKWKIFAALAAADRHHTATVNERRGPHRAPFRRGRDWNAAPAGRLARTVRVRARAYF